MASQAALVDAVSTLMTAEYSAFAMFAFVSYDWLINLDKEIRFFWNYRDGHKLTAASLLYGLSRYPTIVAEILQLQTAFPLSDMSCRVISYLQTATTIPYALAPATFSTIRVYALSPNNKALAIAIFLLLFVPTLVVTIINAIDTFAEQPSPFNCSAVATPLTPQEANRLSLAGRVLAIGGDLLVLLVTWHNTYTSSKAQRGVLKGPSLVNVMLYNGSFYFIIITAMNVLNVILNPISTPTGVSLGSIATLANNPVTAVLTCHFLFDLREAHRSAAAPPSSPSALPSLHFAGGDSEGGRAALPAFIASMGSQLHAPGMPLVEADALVGDEDDVLADGEEEGRARKQGMAGVDENATGVSDAVQRAEIRESV